MKAPSAVPTDPPSGPLEMDTAVVILAAGEGSRHRGPQNKLLRPLSDKPLVLWSIEVALEAAVGDVYVVTGAVDLLDILPQSVTVIQNHDWAQGQSSSLRAGVMAVEKGGYSSVVVGLGDMPFVPPQAFRDVATTPGQIVTATFNRKRRPPVKLSAEVWPLLPLFDSDEGARSLMRRHPELVKEVACNGNPKDYDTEADFRISARPETNLEREQTWNFHTALLLMRLLNKCGSY